MDEPPTVEDTLAWMRIAAEMLRFDDHPLHLKLLGYGIDEWVDSLETALSLTPTSPWRPPTTTP
jgi:hypothetical protein